MTNPADPHRYAPPPAAKFRAWLLLPYLVLVMSLAVTFQIWRNAQHDAVQVLQAKFDFRAREVSDDIKKRMKAYEQVMRGVDGLFAHADIVERSEFHDYIARLRVKENYPGVQGIRFSPLVPYAQKDRHIAAMRGQGFSGYTIHPDGRRGLYTPVIYAEPYDERNKSIFGYDTYSDLEHPRPGDFGAGMRRTAMEQARDSGEAVISGKIALLFETGKDRQAGFLMFLPVYRHDAPRGTLEERRANIIGWISSVFRAGDLMGGILGGHAGEVDIDLYDGEEISERTLMYDADGAGAVNEANKDAQARFHKTQHLEIAGHKWTISVSSLPAFEAQQEKEKPRAIAWVGIGASVLFALLAWLLVYGREHALQAAAAVRHESRKNEMLLQTASDGIHILDIHGDVVQANDAFCRMLGYTHDEIMAMNVVQWDARFSAEELKSKIASLIGGSLVFETRHRRRDGSFMDVEVSAVGVEIDGRELLYCSGRNITERKRAEEGLRDSEHRLREAQRVAHIGDWNLDLADNVLTWSDEIYRIFEIDPEKFGASYEVFMEAVHPGDRERVGNAYTESVRNKTPYDIEHRLLMKDGRIKYVNERCETYYGEDGKPLRSFGTVHDITERRRTEAAFHTIAGTAVSNVGTSFFQETISSVCALLEADCFIIGKLVDGNRMQALGMQLDGKIIEHYEYALPGTPCEIAIGGGYREYPENVSQLFPNDRDLVDIGGEAYIGVPTRSNDGKVNGILCGIFRRKLAPQPMRREVMEIIAARAGAEIDRQQAEQALRESEERWGFALEGSGDGVWDWDLQTGKIVFSKRYKKMLGFPEEAEWNNLDEWKDRVNPEDMAHAMVALEAHLDGKTETYTAEYRMQCKDGGWKWILARGKVVGRAADGRPVRMIGTHTDITERKQAAEALRQSEEQLRLLLDSAAEAIYGIDMYGNCTFCNPSCLRLLGYQQVDDLIGKNMHRLIHHKHADETHFPLEECRIYKAFQSGVNTHVDDEVFWRADGTSFPVEYWSHPQLRNGVAVGAVVTFLDISERKLAEEKLLKLSRAVENSPASVVITNMDGVIEYVNKRFTAVTGYLPEEVIGQNPRVLSSGIQSKEFFQQFWATLLAGKEWAGEIYNRKKSGELYVEYAVISPIRDEKGAITHFVAVKDDITERKRIEEDLQRSMAAADAANRAKSDFLANMSHEIRTPMNAIIGLSHLCLQTDLSAKQLDYLQKVHNSAKSLLGIINDILDFSKIEAGKMDIENVPFDIEGVMGSLATILATRAEEKGLEFLLETSLDVPPHLMGDPLRLGQVLTNLMGNAIKFTEKGEVGVLTEVEENAAEHVVLRFTVRDTGIGLTQEQIDRLFQAFTQADATTTRRFGGTGLGLSISKRMVNLMHGEIWVESTPGAGSKFIFTARFQKAAGQAKKPSLPMPDLHGLRVLAVDDNESCRHILEVYLGSFTFNVTLAAGGAEAVQAVERADRGGMPYDMVVMDWKMPQMDGIRAAQEIRKLAGLSRMPKILLISAFGQSEMLQHMNDHEVDGVLAKPFQQSELFDATMEIFGHGEIRGKSSVLTELFHPDHVAKISGAYLLLAEDNEINQQIARELLEKAGMTVAVAENGKEALDMIARERFDGVLMDMQMPVMDGLAATREIRKNPAFAGLPVIAMTANVLASDREQCLAAGMNDHIAKPFDPARMLETLAKWITPAQPAAAPAAARAVVVQPEALPDLPGVKVAEGVRRMGGSVASYCAVLDKFRIGQQNAIADIRAVLSAGDQKKAERLVHTLKGLLGTLGADVLQDKVAELESGVREGDNARIEPLLGPIEAELAQLFAAIDIVLQSRVEESGDEAAGTNDQVNMGELLELVCKASLQLEEFDSSVEESMARIHRIVGGNAAMKKPLASIERCISNYDYENGLAELTAWAKELRISCEG